MNRLAKSQSPSRLLRVAYLISACGAVMATGVWVMSIWLTCVMHVPNVGVFVVGDGIVMYHTPPPLAATWIHPLTWRLEGPSPSSGPFEWWFFQSGVSMYKGHASFTQAVPLWAIGVILSGPVAWRVVHRQKRRHGRCCVSCGYSLEEIPSAVPCPECGKNSPQTE